MSAPEVDTLRKFVFERLLNQDTRTKLVNILGKIDGQPAIIIAEKTAFDTSPEILQAFAQPANLSQLSVIENNDIYYWYHASQTSGELPQHSEVKLTLIYPATDAHIRKYSVQNVRMVTETPEIYREHVKPYIELKTAYGRLNWVYNVLEKKAEAESIIFEDNDPVNGFILSPDLKWDRKTMSSLYAMAIVHRRDIKSIRDLKKTDAPWLREMQKKIIQGLRTKYPEVDEDQLRVYVHYQPSYYHFHIHVVSISHDGGGGQVAGKAILLQNIISQLETMAVDGLDQVEFAYSLGEESELWQNVFLKLKNKKIE